MPRTDDDVRQMRETLAGDVARAAKQATAGNVDAWTPLLAFIPEQTRAHAPYLRDYYAFSMQRREGEPRCRLGMFCQGHLLVDALDAPYEKAYTLAQYVDPATGKGYAQLCVLCLHVAASVAALRGRPRLGFRGWPPFRLSEYVYGAECVEFKP